MAEDRMALLEMLRKATADGDTDFLREGVRVLAQAVMEAEVSELTGLPKGERDPDAPPDAPQRVPRPALGHPGGHDRPRRAAGPRRLVPAQPARPAPAHRARPARGRPGGVRGRHEHAPGGRPRAGPGHRGHQPQRGVPDVRPARRRGAGLPLPAARRDHVPVPLARRHVPARARGQPRRVDGGPGRGRGRGQRGAPDPRASSCRPATTRAPPGRASSARSSSAACAVSAWSSATATRGS